MLYCLLFDGAKLLINFDMCKKKMRKVYLFNNYYKLTTITFIIETNNQSNNKGIPFPSTFARSGIPLPFKSSCLVFDLVDLSVNFNSDNVGEVDHVGLDLVFDLCTALGDNL